MNYPLGGEDVHCHSCHLHTVVLHSPSAPPPLPALGTHSGVLGTPFCCLGCRISHPKSSLMSPYCPALLEHNVLPLPSHLPAIIRTFHGLYHQSVQPFLRV